jgi:hypothetical protein
MHLIIIQRYQALELWRHWKHQKILFYTTITDRTATITTKKRVKQKINFRQLQASSFGQILEILDFMLNVAP